MTCTHQNGRLGTLETPQGDLPLVAVEIEAAIDGLSARTKLTQVFRNDRTDSLDACYTFRLPDRACVVRFAARIGERTNEWLLTERAGVQHPSVAAEVEAQRAAEVFSVELGRIGAGDRVEVLLDLVGPLSVDGDEVTFSFPLTALPFSITTGQGAGSEEGEGVLLPGPRRSVQLKASIDIDTQCLAMQDIASSLPAEMSGAGTGRTRVEVRCNQGLDRDLVLKWRIGSPDVQAFASLQPDRDGDEATLSLLIVPPRPDPRTLVPRDVVVLLDRSGSMEGWQMTAARRAAARIVDCLTSADRVSVLAFDHEVALGERAARLAPATDRQRHAATSYLSRLQARGGTQTLDAMHAAAAALGPADPARRRILVLVTDGQIESESHFAAVMRGPLSDATLHVVGIDRAVPAGVLQRLAQLGAGDGHWEQVESQDRLESALGRVRDRIAAPFLTAVDFDVEGASILPDTVLPPHRISCPAGVPTVLRSRVRVTAPVRVRLRGRGSADERWTADLGAVPGIAEADTVLWARERIRVLEDRWLDGSGERDASRREAVATSLRFLVACRFTGFAAATRDGEGLWEASARDLPDEASDPAPTIPQHPQETWAQTELMDFLDWIDRLLEGLEDAISRGGRTAVRRCGEDLGQLLVEFDARRGPGQEDLLSQQLHELAALCEQERINTAAMRSKSAVARRLIGYSRQRLRLPI